MKLLITHKQKRQLISLTPLIDVVFILLLFFMLSTSFISAGSISLELGTSTSKVTQDTQAQDQFVIRLLADGDLSIDDQRTSFASSQLQSLLDDAFQNDRNAVIRYDNEADVQDLMQLLDQLNTLSIDTESVRVGW